MKLFKCDKCNWEVYFDNTYCSNCRNLLGFDPLELKMVSLQVDNLGNLSEVEFGKGFHYCSNKNHGVCNWVIPDTDLSSFCIACSLNRTIPNIDKTKYLERWRIIEDAKHRLIYALLRWKLPVFSKLKDWEHGLAFDFKSDEGLPEGQRVLTGHANGLITMNIAEADDVEREMARNQMDEVYRTVLGHFRHEVGHYYWDLLVAGSENLQDFRELFGDETFSYIEALDRHYKNGAPRDWNRDFISPYATMHPWEDWAETWAHYLHIVGSLETAYSYGLTINPISAGHNPLFSTPRIEDPYECVDFEIIFKQWVPLSLVMNSLNRSMGAKDVYPFVINLKVKEKLRFIHDIIQHFPCNKES